MKRIINLHINEKFTPESDPVFDLGVGVPAVAFYEKCHEYAKKAESQGVFRSVSDIRWYSEETKETFIDGVLGSFSIESNHKTLVKTDVKRPIYGHAWESKYEQFRILLVKKEYDGEFVVHVYNVTNGKSYFPKKIAGFLAFTKGYKQLQVDEKFTPESDPIVDMGIGAINKIFEISKHFYSFTSGYYSEKEWKKIISWMLEEYEPWEVLGCLDNRIMRDAYDNLSKYKRKATLNDFQNYNVKYMSSRRESEMDRLLNNYRLLQTKWVEHYRDMAKEAGLYKEPMYEKFTDTSTDPVADMGIGGYSFETVSTGALIKLKPSYRSLVSLTKNNSGQFSDIHGMRISHENCIVVSSVVNFSDGRKDIHIKKFPSEAVAREFRDNWAKDRMHTPWGGSNNRMIVSKLQFERRFEIIERGFNQVKESLNEKFTDKSDPLKDMGIGLKKVIVDRAKDMFKDAQYDIENGDGFRLVEIRFDAFTADVITNYPFAVKAAQEWLVEEFKTHELDEFFELETSITHSESDDHIFWNIDFKEKYEMIFSMEDRIVINYKTINESLNEKFSEEGDPVAQMGIGIRKKIDEYIKEHDDENDVENKLLTPIMFLCRQGDLNDETKKNWIEFLLREGKDEITEWENSDFEIMDDIGVRFIPNVTQLPDEKFSYKVNNGQYYLYCGEWEDFTYYFELHNDIDHKFIEKVLSGDGRDYFEYNYDRPLKLDEIIDSLSKFEEPELFEFLKPFCEERSEEAKEAKTLYELFDIIENNEDLQGIDNALLSAFANNIAEAEETAAYNELVNAIKRGLKVSEADHQGGNLVLKLSEDSVNTFFKMYWSDAYHIDYYPPQYGWGGDFNLEYFKEDFESNLQD